MKRSSRTTRTHVSIPKLRIRSKKTLYDEGPSTSDNILERRKMEDINPSFEELETANYIQLKSSSEQQMHDHEVLINEDVNNLADTDDDNIFSAEGNIPADNYEPKESGIEERSVLDDDKSEDSGIYDDLDEVLEEFSLDFEGFDGEYGPYFPNFTSAMIYIWITKHMISTSAYEDLAKILKHPKYRKEDVTTNIRQIRKWRDRLPLAKVRKHDVPLSMHKTPSTYASTKKAFTISPLTHLERVLNNPLLMSKMYFGPGIIVNEKREFWHGELWQDSLLFGEDKIKSKNEEYYRAGDFLLYHEQSSTFICRVRGIVIDELDNNTLKLKVDTLLSHENLPNCRFNDNRHTRGNNMELWLVEDAVKLVNPANIEQRIVVWLCDMPEPDEYDYYIKEIVYYFDGHWKYREIATRHKLPCEYITLSQSQQDLPTLKIFLDIYIDDFGTYRNVYHSLGGVYLQFGNMPLNLRKQIKNHFLIGFVPFGADFNDFIKPVIQDIKSLENGLIMQTLYGKAWVIGGIGCITADLPQGNDLAGVKRHGANHGCRTCNVLNSQYTNPSYDYVKNARFKQQTNERIAEIKNQSSKRDQDRLAIEYGLIEPGSFNVLKWDQHIQTPQDAYHSMAGKARTLLDATFNIFNANGEKEFLKYWKCIEKPTHWSRMPNPVQHRQSFMFSDILRISRTLKVRKPSSGSRIQNTEHAALDFISKVRNSISRRTTKSGIPFRGGPLSPELFRGGPVFRRSGTPLEADYDISKVRNSLEVDRYFEGPELFRGGPVFRRSGTLFRGGPLSPELHRRTIKSGTPLEADYDISKVRNSIGGPLSPELHFEADYDISKVRNSLEADYDISKVRNLEADRDFEGPELEADRRSERSGPSYFEGPEL
ncbi:hypothetical protein GLOIN_2v1880882 [Rhizophagus clarus]|uniref:BAH domain-containing protein n=1 Tax=Rhizophagus clarus TaxID=94130 RepID=A0A8H3R0N2_9GLOM|nr:hypothetical protein GLOIN_2v1880882 [Rhizophagus clarus]